MQTTPSQDQRLETLSRIRRVHGNPDDLYEVIFVDQNDQIVVPLTEVVSITERTGTSKHERNLSRLFTPFSDVFD